MRALLLGIGGCSTTEICRRLQSCGLTWSLISWCAAHSMQQRAGRRRRRCQLSSRRPYLCSPGGRRRRFNDPRQLLPSSRARGGHRILSPSQSWLRPPSLQRRGLLRFARRPLLPIHRTPPDRSIHPWRSRGSACRRCRSWRQNRRSCASCQNRRGCSGRQNRHTSPRCRKRRPCCGCQHRRVCCRRQNRRACPGC